eukprot:TRINITY_DN2050_c0_g1_i2.p1 TRINITY_DN2050_c0_g1~~TRINITY_DN2050_c0_g1_i2.p1  ORF type:complete len:777 (+),score=227.70 TRINITY_DN2050_c0_g1_i2:529-2859(+)
MSSTASSSRNFKDDTEIGEDEIEVFVDPEEPNQTNNGVSFDDGDIVMEQDQQEQFLTRKTSLSLSNMSRQIMAPHIEEKTASHKHFMSVDDNIFDSERSETSPPLFSSASSGSPSSSKRIRSKDNLKTPPPSSFLNAMIPPPFPSITSPKNHSLNTKLPSSSSSSQKAKKYPHRRGLSHQFKQTFDQENFFIQAPPILPSSANNMGKRLFSPLDNKQLQKSITSPTSSAMSYGSVESSLSFSLSGSNERTIVSPPPPIIPSNRPITSFARSSSYHQVEEKDSNELEPQPEEEQIFQPVQPSITPDNESYELASSSAPNQLSAPSMTPHKGNQMNLDSTMFASSPFTRPSDQSRRPLTGHNPSSETNPSPLSSPTLSPEKNATIFGLGSSEPSACLPKTPHHTSSSSTSTLPCPDFSAFGDETPREKSQQELLSIDRQSQTKCPETPASAGSRSRILNGAFTAPAFWPLGNNSHGPRAVSESSRGFNLARRKRESPERVSITPKSPPHSELLAKPPQYEMINKLGEGSFGQVWKVNIEGKMFAMKIITKPKNDIMNEFLYARIIGTHDNILHYHSAWVEKGRLHILFDLYENGNLQTYLAKKYSDPPKEEEILQVIADVASGLSKMHEKHIAHMDIKPSNLLLGPSNRIVIGDLGTAFSVLEGKKTEGDGLYLAPEVLNGSYAESADIFSLGLTAYEMASNYVIMRGPFLDGVRAGHVEYPERWAHSDKLKSLLNQMMDPNPFLRPTAKEVLKNELIAPFASKKKSSAHRVLNFEEE